MCFLTLTEKTFSKRAAFSFLEELSSEFHREFGHKVATATRPYSFIEFGEHLTMLLILGLISLSFFQDSYSGGVLLILLIINIWLQGNRIVKQNLFEQLWPKKASAACKLYQIASIQILVWWAILGFQSSFSARIFQPEVGQKSGLGRW